ncbi:MAG: MFS transporter [Chloroflexota bacterium]
MTQSQSRPWWRRLTLFVLAMLAVEFMDEFFFSAFETARPLIRDAFTLTYIELGLLTTIPVLVAIVVEPIIGLFADTKYRRPLMLLGGISYGIGLIVQGFAPSFLWFMLGAILEFPASGAFINIAQASLMDDAPTRRENRMALWTFSGSLAVVIGPLALALLLWFGLEWRVFFISTGIVFFIVSFVLLLLPANKALRSTDDDDDDERTIRENLQGALDLLRQWAVWRWLILLEFSNLMLDVLFALLALYMVDVVGVSQAQATFAIIVWTGVGLLGDFLLIPLLERVDGLRYLRFSALMELILYPAFLLIDLWWLKLVILGIIGLFNAGWYAILQGKLYDALGDQSGAVLIVGNAAGIFGAILPLILGAIAETFGLNVAMWCLLISPIILMLGLPKRA